MNKKNRLGKGLESLIPTLDVAAPDTAEAAAVAGQFVEELPVDAVSANPHQPRTEFSQDELRELADSIKVHGLIQPIVVIKRDGSYELVSGERRLRASKLAGKSTISAIVRTASEQERLELAVVENLQRSDLSALELCYAYKRMIDDFGMTQDEVAQKVGKSRSSVANALRLAMLPDNAKEALLKGMITEGHARAILSVPEENRIAFFELILVENLSVRQAEERANGFNPSKELPASGKVKTHSSPSADDKKISSELQDYLGAKVRLERSGKGGRLNIEFYSDEELDRIISRITGSQD